MNLKFKKSWLPNIIAIVLFAVIAIVYFYPALEGYSIRQGDVTNWHGMSKEIQDFRAQYDSEPLWTNSMFGGMPTYQTSFNFDSGFYIFRDILRLIFSKAASHLFLAFTAFFVLLRTLKSNTYLSFFGALTYGLSTYNLLIIEAGHNTKMATLAIAPLALAFLIKSIQAKKVNLIYIALFTLTFGFQISANHIQMTYYISFVYASLGVYYLIHAIKENNLQPFLKICGTLILGIGLAVSSNFSSIYHTKQFAKETMRGDKVISISPNGNEDITNITSTGLKKDYITQWSYGIGETYNLLVPNAKGNSRHLTREYFDYLKEKSPKDYKKAVQFYQQSRGQLFKGYWGNQPFTSGPNYIGAILVFLALLYILLVKEPLKWILLIPTILALLLSWGKNMMWLTDLFIDYFPLYNKFRTVSSFLIVLNLTIPLMAILFLNKVIEDKEWRENNIKSITNVGGGIIGLVLILAFVPFGFDFTSNREDAILASMNNTDLDVLMEYLVDFRKSVFRMNSLKSIGQMIVALALILGFIKSKIKLSWMVVGIGAISAVNLWLVDKQFMNNEKANGKYLYWEKQTPLKHSIKATKGDHDIFNLENNDQILADINSRTKSFRKDHGRRMTTQDKESIQFSSLGFNSNYRVLNLDNPFNSAIVSYFHKSSGGYSPAKLRRYQDMIDFYISKELQLLSSAPQNMKALNMLNTKYYLQSGNLVYSNPYAFGNAWFVNSVKSVSSNNDEILEFKNIDPKTTAVIHTEFSNTISETTYQANGNTIQLTDYKPNHLTYNANCTSKGLAVFSEIYFKNGWQAYIDGKKVDHVRANYILRALEIPQGNHKIEFKFEVSTYSTGNYINMISFLVIVGSLIFIVFTNSKNK